MKLTDAIGLTVLLMLLASMLFDSPILLSIAIAMAILTGFLYVGEILFPKTALEIKQILTKKDKE